MKLRKKTILMLCVLAFALLAGCSSGAPEATPAPTDAPAPAPAAEPATDAPGEDGPGDDAAAMPAYPIMTPKDMSGAAMETAEDGGIRISYPADEWTALTDVGALSLVYLETAGAEDGNAVNFNIIPSARFDGWLDESHLEMTLEQFDEMAGYMTVELAELRYLHGEPVIYVEMTAEYTDAFIDAMIAEGTITEEWLAENGGRDVFLQQPVTKHIAIYAIADGWLCIYSGAYFEDVHKQDLLDAMCLAVETTEVLE